MTCPYLESTSNEQERATHITENGSSNVTSINENEPKEPLNYTTYLRVDQLLSALKCLSHEDSSNLSSAPVHDEHFFIMIHQAFELYFKQILYEIDSIRHIFETTCKFEDKMRSMFNVNTRLNRCVKIWSILLEQMTLLETMTPMEFLEFRDFITPASGFQSLQFRLIEFKLGLNDVSRQQFKEKYYYNVMFKNNQAEELKRTLEEPSLLVLLQNWLEQIYDDAPFNFLTIYEESVQRFIENTKKQKLANGVSFDSVESDAKATEHQFSFILDRGKYEVLLLENQRRMSHKAMLAALMISVYHQEPCFQQAYQMLYLLMDIDSQMANWRQKHVLLVQRQIGRKPGTGGTGGFSYLVTTLGEQYQVFIDLFNVASYLIPQRFLPTCGTASHSSDKTLPSPLLSSLNLTPPKEIPIVSQKSTLLQSRTQYVDDGSWLITLGVLLLVPLVIGWMIWNALLNLF